MKATNKRLIGILLALAMVLSVLPMAVFAADTTTIYCDAPDSWTSCYVHFWGGSAASSWPGVAMTKGADGIWYAEVDATSTGILFHNNAGTQCTDLQMPTNDEVQYNYEAKAWSTYGEVIETPEFAMITLYVEVPDSWGAPNAYFWGSANVTAPGWPGNAMTHVDGNIYSYEFPNDCTGLIFNDGANQTIDLTIPTDDNVLYSNLEPADTKWAGTWGPMVVAEPVDVKWQLNAGATPNDAAVDLRLITWVDSLDYADVTFDVTIAGENAAVSCQTVYETINANGQTLTCEDLFGCDGYLVTFTITDVEADLFDDEISVFASRLGINGMGAENTAVRTFSINENWA